MSNVLSEEKKQQVIALGKLGWSLRGIERETGVRRETASVYLKAAGVTVRLPGGWGRRAPAKPAIGVTTDLVVVSPPEGPGSSAPPERPASVCEPHRELIQEGLARGRNAVAIWQDLASDHGFAGSYQTVKRFVRKLRGSQLAQATGIILTAAGEEAQVDYGSGPMVRDPQRTLDNFDFNFNKKLNRSLVFDLATATFVARHEDALFLGPPGTGKSHLAQAIGQAVITQGYRVIYREAHILLEEIADAALDGKRKEHMELLATVPLLIIDDLGMRKLGPTAAEEPPEIVMRRYERASTLLASNRPVGDWGKLLGDSAAVTAMLDRLLHHGHLLKRGPRSWRTKTDAPEH